MRSIEKRKKIARKIAFIVKMETVREFLVDNFGDRHEIVRLFDKEIGSVLINKGRVCE